MATEDEETKQEGAEGEDVKQIQEALKSAAAKEENDNTPEGLAYHVNAFELEVEKFLEVDSWNDVHGIDITKDECEEKHVEEMKAVQEEGDKRRAVIKKGFQSGEEKLGGIDKELEELSKRIEATATEAERAAKSEQATNEAGDASSNRAKNPFSEYRDQVKELEGKPAGEASGMRGSILQMDDSSAKSRMERLKAESELLRKCLKDGNKGNFSSYSTTVAGK